MKRKVTKISRLSGIVLGFALTFFIFVFSMTSVFQNRDFWLKQNDRYKHQETLDLVSSDDYSTLYRNYLALFDGESNDFTVTKRGNPDDFTDTFMEVGSFSADGSVYNKEITLSQKYLNTIRIIDAEKYSKTELAKKFFVEFYCPETAEAFKGITIGNLKITDKAGNDFTLDLREANSIKNGNIAIKKIDFSQAIEFKPESIGNRLRVYLTGDNYDSVKLSFSLGAEEVTDVFIRFSYEEILTADDVADRIGTEIEVLSDSDREQFLHAASITNSLYIIAWVLLIIAVVLFLYTANREGREGLFGIGTYTIILSVLLVCIFIALTYSMPVETGFNWVFDFAEGSASDVVLGRNFMSDYVSGLTKFFVFLMLAPVFIGYLLVKKSVKREYDPNEDYMYQ